MHAPFTPSPRDEDYFLDGNADRDVESPSSVEF